MVRVMAWCRIAETLLTKLMLTQITDTCLRRPAPNVLICNICNIQIQSGFFFLLLVNYTSSRHATCWLHTCLIIMSPTALPKCDHQITSSSSDHRVHVFYSFTSGRRGKERRTLRLKGLVVVFEWRPRSLSWYLLAQTTFTRVPYALLTHWGRDKMATIFQTTFSIAFPWMKMYDFQLKFQWRLFLRIKLTIFQHWLR